MALVFPNLDEMRPVTLDEIADEFGAKPEDVYRLAWSYHRISAFQIHPYAAALLRETLHEYGLGMEKARCTLLEKKRLAAKQKREARAEEKARAEEQQLEAEAEPKDSKPKSVESAPPVFVTASKSTPAESTAGILTKAELAAKLGVAVRTIERNVALGRIPVLKLGPRLVRFDWNQVCARAQVNFKTGVK